MLGGFGRRALRLFGAASSVALLLASGAYAQDNSASGENQESDEIVVTGFRASLRNSAEVKRTATSIVEVVSAEEMGKLPDNSITESLARLPGITAQRLFGRGQVISIRGLSPDFSTALLNGREQVSAGDNRGVEFDQFPSELLQQVVVYKTPDAALIGQGLSGTADMRTVRPLSYSNRTFSVSGRYEWNDVGALNSGTDDDGYRFTGSYIDQTDDGVWGFAIGAAITSSPTQAERWEAWGYPNAGEDADHNPIPENPFVVGGAKPYVQSSVLERDGYLGVVQYRPSENFTSTLDVFYSEFEETQILRGIELPLFWGGVGLEPGSFTIEDGFVTSGTWIGILDANTQIRGPAVEGVVRNDIRARDSTIKAIGWANELEFGEAWTLRTDLSYSSVERHDIDLELWAGTGSGRGVGAADELGFTTGGGGGLVFTHQLDYSDPSLILLTDPAGWGSVGFIKEPQIEDSLGSLRASIERTFDGPISSIEVGANVSEREKSKESIENFVRLANPGLDNAVPLPSDLELAPTNLDFIGMGPVLSFDPRAALASGVYVLDPLLHTDVAAKAWSVEERVTTVYLKADIDTALGSLPLTGNFGVQYVHTDQSSSGQSATGSGGTFQFVPRTEGDEYGEWLPSLNLALNFTDNDRLRLGAARTLARPRMDEMRASFQFNWNVNPAAIANTDPSNPQGYWNGNGGNPQLRPWIANSVDLSYEHYLGAEGYIAVAAFYKDLESYIFPQNEIFDFAGYPLSPNQPLDPNTNLPIPPAITQGVVSTFQNGTGGEIKGLELTAVIPGELILSWLEGFGVSVNASFTESTIQPPNTPASALPGLSDTVINATIYFEKAGFEARVSNRYRSDFLGEVTGFGANRVLRFVNGESVLDAQVGYRFGTGPLEGLALVLQANNIFDEPFGTFQNGDERQVIDYQRYGSTYLLGVSYRR